MVPASGKDGLRFVTGEVEAQNDDTECSGTRSE